MDQRGSKAGNLNQMGFHKLGITVETESDVLGISGRKERGALKFLWLFVLSIAFFGLSSCGTATSTAITCTTSTTTATNSSTNTCTDPVTNISITISPSTVSVNVVTTQLFQASLSGGTKRGRQLREVNSITGGNDSVGRIDSNGLYHSPSTIPNPATVTVTAVSFEDQNLSASAAVAITPAPAVTINLPLRRPSQ